MITVFMKSESLIVESKISWVHGYDLETKSYRHFPYNENPMRALNTTSLKCCLPLTLLKGGKNSRMRMKVQGRFMQAHFVEIHQVFTKKKVDYFSNRLVVSQKCEIFQESNMLLKGLDGHDT